MKMVGFPKLFYSNLSANNTNSVSRTNSNSHVSFSGSDFKIQEMSTDVVQLSQMKKSTNKLLKYKDDIAEMRRNGVSQEEIARKFNVKRFEVVEFLETYLSDVQRDDVILRNAVKKYLSANSNVEKNDAFNEVDVVLQKIAANKVKTQNGVTYQDCLQDLRLKLLELVKQCQEKNRIVYTQVLQDLKNYDNSPIDNNFISYVPDIDSIQSNETELDDFVKHDLLSYLICNSGLFQREQYIVFSLLFNGKSLNEVGNQLGLTNERIKHLLSKASKKMNTEYRRISSNEYLNQQLNWAAGIMNKIEQDN